MNLETHTNLEKKILRKFLKIRMVIKVIQQLQRTQKRDKKNLDYDLYKMNHFSKSAVLFSDNLPLLAGILHNSVVRSDLSLSTAHSEPHTNIMEFCGLNPVPVTVMV